MRYPGFVSLAFSAALLLPGCGPYPSSTPESGSKMSNASEKIKDAAVATAEAAGAKRDEYVNEMSKQLDKLNVKYEELKARVAKADEQTKKDLEPKLEAARVKRDAAVQRLNELKEASVDRWEKVKTGVGSALEDLKKAFE